MLQPKSFKNIRALRYFSVGLFLFAFCLIIYDATIGHFLFGKSYGPGAYYYTDVPDWNKIFMNTDFLGFNHPVLAGIFFVAWAVFMYKLLCLLNDKL